MVDQHLNPILPERPLEATHDAEYAKAVEYLSTTLKNLLTPEMFAGARHDDVIDLAKVVREVYQ
jgi:hypothetical protein